jgi:uncharacterized protein (DUF1697 family)
MTIHIGLLRAVNLGAHNRIAMSDLRELVAGLGLRDARTLLLSGNVVFRSDGPATTHLERLLENAAKEHLGLETDFFVRTARDWKAVIARNPFPEDARRDPGHLLVMFLKHAPDRAAVTALQKAITGREVVRADGRQAYVVYPDGIGRSRLTSLLIEKKLGTRGTGRNWNTVLKLAALTEPSWAEAVDALRKRGDQSVRMASNGLTDAALRAGRYDAARATRNRTADMLTNVAGSNGLVS